MNLGNRRLWIISALIMAITPAMVVSVQAAERKVHFDVDGLT